MAMALPLEPRSIEARWVWVLWRRRQRENARQSHYRRRGLHAPVRRLLEITAQVPL